ncbi:MAG: branched-chain amino acid ABC transporter permease, partial [Actinomycetota bacterium]|nr:branched-chain amino acid ABC transporter permease [Actinomycetota bacterium]
ISALLKRRSTLFLLLVPLIAVGFALQAFGTPLILNIYTYFCVNLMIVLALQMFMGNSGILAWTHVAWVGIGAYASGILSMAPMVKSLGVPNMYPQLVALQLPVVPAILLGGVVAAIVAGTIGWPLMRLSNAVGVITLFATLIVVHVVMTQWDNVTNGPRTFFGLQDFTRLPQALVGAILVLLLAHWYRESSLGLRLRASRDDRFAAMAIGVSVVQVRYVAFVLSALIAGMSGGVWAHFITSFSPKAFYITETFLLLTMLVIGGQGSISGAFTGTAIVTVAREVLRQVESGMNNSGMFSFEVYGLTELVMAVLMVIVLIWRPNGIIGGQEITWPLLKRKNRPDDGPGTDVVEPA